ncbi:PrgI family protein [Candidatus Saccharibacteria bacterium]|nr:PrgI family protein [Candidatus Saccharibacteria bacterium]
MPSSYKVPQDVEADDKLIGPFSFRQFIYLIVVALAGALAWGLAQIFIVLAIIPLPIILLFGALALPLRKDQPMEIYLAAIVSFFLKPHKRFWDPEGVETLIEVSAPKTTEESRVKDLSGSEAEQRLGYLANIVDSGGWAIRGAGTTPNSAMISDVFYDAQNTEDILDANNTVGQSIEYLMGQRAEKSKKEALDKMRSALTPQPQVQPQQQPAATAPQPTQQSQPAPNPFPPAATELQQPEPVVDDIHQKIIQPIHDLGDTNAPVVDLASELAPKPAPAQAQPPQPEPQQSSTSETPPTADIMNLATNSDISVETLGKEASRLNKKVSTEDEAFLSLR